MNRLWHTMLLGAMLGVGCRSDRAPAPLANVDVGGARPVPVGDHAAPAHVNSVVGSWRKAVECDFELHLNDEGVKITSTPKTSSSGPDGLLELEVKENRIAFALHAAGDKSGHQAIIKGSCRPSPQGFLYGTFTEFVVKLPQGGVELEIKYAYRLWFAQKDGTLEVTKMECEFLGEGGEETFIGPFEKVR